jgi:carbonic anhydrase
VDRQVTAVLITLFFFGFLVLVIGWLIVASIIDRRREQERTRLMVNVASLLGWQFNEVAGLNWIPNLETFALFSQGHSKQIKNVMYGEIDGVKAAVFDYYYVVGHGKHRSTFNQSVVYFEPRNLNLPPFSLRPEHTFHKIISAFGYQDIDFGNRPDFSSKYLLRGPDEQGIRSIFTDALLGFYEMNEGTSTDGAGNQLFIFRQNSRPAPHETQAFLNWSLQLQRLYGSRW